MKRRFIKYPKFPGIYKIEVFDTKTRKWREPGRGKKYKVSQYTNGKRKWQFCETFEEAKGFKGGVSLESKQAEHIHFKLTANQSNMSSKTFGEIAQIWLNNYVCHLSITTREKYKGFLKHYRFLADLQIESISPITIDQWLAGLKKPDYLASQHSTRCSYRNEFKVLKQIFDYYCERFNPQFSKPFVKNHSKLLKVKTKPINNKDLTLEELALFVQAMNEIYGGSKKEIDLLITDLSEMQYATYTRIQNTAALHYEDFDLKKGKVKIQRKVIWPRRKGLSTFFDDGTKTDSGFELKLSDQGIAVFKAYRLKSGIRSGPLFSVGGKPIEYRSIQHRYDRAFKRAGLKQTATHVFRHGSLTEFYNETKDLRATMEVANHSDVTTTSRYAKVRESAVRDGQKAISDRYAKLKRT